LIQAAPDREAFVETLPVNTLAEGLLFPEGPAFDRSGALWLVELKGGRLTRWTQDGLQRHDIGGGPNGSAVDAQGRVFFTDSADRCLRRFDPATCDTTTITCELGNEPLNKPNDLAFDKQRNLVFTCPGESRHEPTGYVAVLTHEVAVRKVAESLYFPNGLAFTPDGEELIVAETYRQRLWRGRWEAETGRWLDPRVWATGLDGPPGPDGMAFAADGTLFVAVYGSGSVAHIDQDGAIMARYALPGRNPTNCAFDPSGELGLVVTEAEHGRLLSLPDLGPGAPLFT
jgi:gluconolactonase